MITQEKFNLMVGTLDECLSFFVSQGRTFSLRIVSIREAWDDHNRRVQESSAQIAHSGPRDNEFTIKSEDNYQTVKHHAEDMILAGRKILKDLGEEEPK